MWLAQLKNHSRAPDPALDGASGLSTDRKPVQRGYPRRIGARPGAPSSVPDMTAAELPRLGLQLGSHQRLEHRPKAELPSPLALDEGAQVRRQGSDVIGVAGGSPPPSLRRHPRHDLCAPRAMHQADASMGRTFSAVSRQVLP